MNIGLACNYRIVADNTVYQNPNVELNMVPKGGSAFFCLRCLAQSPPARVLLSKENTAADQAYQFGIIDKVILLDDLHRMASEAARHYALLPPGYSIGITIRERPGTV